jgi:iron-sulfur cluster repair protein YtfE (RIC family)
LSTVQVEADVKEALFKIAAELQQKTGRRTSISEAVQHLIRSYHASHRDKARMLALFGCLKGAGDARATLRELREQEETRLATLARKYGTR